MEASPWCWKPAFYARVAVISSVLAAVDDSLVGLMVDLIGAAGSTHSHFIPRNHVGTEGSGRSYNQLAGLKMVVYT